MANRLTFPIPFTCRLVKVLLLVATTISGSFLLGSCGTAPRTSSTTANDVIHEQSLTQEHQQEYRRAIHAIDSDTPEKAASSLESLVDDYPRNLDICINLAVAYYKTGELDKALQQARHALAIDANVADAYNIIGLISAEKSAYQEAEAAYLKALTLMPEHPLVHYNIALMYDIYFQRIDKAVEHYQHYLAAFPDDQHTKLWVDQLKRTLSEG